MNQSYLKNKQKKATVILILAFILFLLVVNYEDFFGSYYLPIKENHASFHTILEACSIFVSLVIVLHGWINFSHSFSRNRLLFAGGFIAVAWFDAMHVLTYNSMPYFIEESSAVHAIYFWSYARITEAIILLILVFFADRSSKTKFYREKIFLFFLFFSMIMTVFTFVFLTEDTLLYYNNQPTLVKDMLEYLTAAIHLAVLIRTYFVLQNHSSISTIYILMASVFLIFTAILLTIYTDVHGFLNVVAHFYKLAGYYYLFKAIYVLQIDKPYRDLKQLNATHELLLNGVGDGIWGVSLKGDVVFMNTAACQMFGYEQEDLIGKPLHSINLTKDKELSQTLKDGQARQKSHEVFYRKDGSLIDIQYETQPLYEEEVISGMIMTFRDISSEIKFQQLEQERKAYETELELASQVQKSLLPSTTDIASFLDIGVVSVPFRKLNGDFYELVSHGNCVSIAVADVMGKGIPAAIQMTMIKHSMSHFIADNNEPSELFNILNKTLMETRSLMDFITMIMMKYDHSSSLLTYCSAGHEPALLYRADHQDFVELTTKNVALGIWDSASYRNDLVKVKSGDHVLLFSDGLIENRNDYAHDLQHSIKTWFQELDSSWSAQQKAEALMDMAKSKMNGKFYDDATLLIVKFK